jgi:formylglycine-generating enzyme required for sulfatase activity
MIPLPRAILFATFLCSACFLQSGLARSVRVEGGALPESAELRAVRVPSFFISPFQTTGAEWQAVQSWATINGYQIRSVAPKNADDSPVRNMSWYDVVKWCNAKSQMEGLAPVYRVSGAVYKRGCLVPIADPHASGYRLPSLAEWVWAARGGVRSRGGGRNPESGAVEDAAWYSRDTLSHSSSDHVVITKVPNALGLYDMAGYDRTGDVGEWCWDLNPPQYSTRRIRGGNWWEPIAVGFTSSYPIYSFPRGGMHSCGFRPVRNAGR